jgi:ribosomal protein S18 acetylase RimI-like enzyme
MLTFELQNYIDIAALTGSFDAHEIEVLKEILLDCCNSANQDYILIEEISQEQMAGFVIIGRTPLTEFSWDIYWVVVDKKFQRQGIGKALMSKVYQYIKSKGPRAVLRVETAGRKDYDYVRFFYQAQGFDESGRIKDFYSSGDDLVIFSRQI